MKVDVVTYSEQLPKVKFENSTVIVIDVLRCTTTMVTALMNGARRIKVFENTDSAEQYAHSLGRDTCILGGERRAIRLPGYDLGNSPLEYNRGVINGKTVVMSTTNGTRAINGVNMSKRTLIGSLINCSAVSKAAVEYNDDIMIVCAGTDGEQSADDLLTAGAIVNIFKKKNGFVFTDAALISDQLYLAWKKGEFKVENSFHCARLLRMGYKKDVEYCLSENITECIPIGKNDCFYKINS